MDSKADHLSSAIDSNPSSPRAAGSRPSGSSAATRGRAAPLPGAFTLLVQAFAKARRRPISTFVALPATVALAIGGCLVPLVNFPFILIALAPISGALPMIALSIAREEKVPIFAPLVGFRRYERFLGLFWVPYLVLVASSLPLLAALWIDRRILYGVGSWTLFAPAAVLSAGIAAVILHRYVLAPFVAADLERSEALSVVLETAVVLIRGRELQIWGRLFLIGLYGVAGAVFFGVGFLLTGPVAVVGAARLFVEASSIRDKTRDQAEPGPS